MSSASRPRLSVGGGRTIPPETNHHKPRTDATTIVAALQNARVASGAGTTPLPGTRFRHAKRILLILPRILSARKTSVWLVIAFAFRAVSTAPPL